MTKNAWKKKITAACEEAGTYRPFFDMSIEKCAEALEDYDRAAKQYKAMKHLTVVNHTNKAGATNIVKNPALVMMQALRQEAFGYWRAMGLTPDGLRKIDEEQMKPQKKNALEDILAEINADLDRVE